MRCQDVRLFLWLQCLCLSIEQFVLSLDPDLSRLLYAWVVLAGGRAGVQSRSANDAGGGARQSALALGEDDKIQRRRFGHGKWGPRLEGFEGYVVNDQSIPHDNRIESRVGC